MLVWGAEALGPCLGEAGRCVSDSSRTARGKAVTGSSEPQLLHLQATEATAEDGEAAPRLCLKTDRHSWGPRGLRSSHLGRLAEAIGGCLSASPEGARDGGQGPESLLGSPAPAPASALLPPLAPRHLPGGGTGDGRKCRLPWWQGG